MRALFAVLALIGAAMYNVNATAQTEILKIGYLELKDDARYAYRRPYAGIQVRTVARPFAGAELAVKGSRIQGRAVGVAFELVRYEGKSADDLATAVARMHAEDGVDFFLTDLSAGVLTEVARGNRDQVLLLNVSERSDALRSADCQPHVLHAIPSYAMLSDALAQYIISKKWREVFMLTGSAPEDDAFAQAFRRSAKRLGADIVASKDFILSNDPRERDKTNIALMTAGEDYDVVFLADSDGEFGRYVPYETSQPRPVIGTEGLVADAWYWAWERHGAPQLNQRFDKAAGRFMEDIDWAAWVSVKVIVEALVRTRSSDFETLKSYILGDELTLDGYKGSPLNFRPWNKQLRQPILLHTHNAVLERAPIRGFLHASNNLDTLGLDQAESQCRSD